MQSALRLTARVQPGHKIEITAPELPEGQDVEVILLLPEVTPSSRKSAMEIIASLQGHRLFETPDDVDQYLHQEREAWER